MSEGVPEGATLPEGIEVDDAAAYFGVVDSSDVLQQMMSMDSKQALSKALEHLADIILRPGEFDFEAASERLQCEGGEIYFLIFGHLNLMALPDPLLQFAGQPDSTGAANTAHPLATGDVVQDLTPLFDPMQFLKILAIAYSTGGNTEVERTCNRLNPSWQRLRTMWRRCRRWLKSSKSSLDVAGHALPMPLFASDQAQPAEIEMGTIIERREPEPAPAPVEPEPEVISEPEPTPRVATPEPDLQSVPLPTDSVPLPSVDSVPLPSQEEPVEEVVFKNEIEVDAAQDAFAGAFGSQLVPEPEVVQNPLKTSFLSLLSMSSLLLTNLNLLLKNNLRRNGSVMLNDSSQQILTTRSLSVEELAVAANVSIHEAEDLHSAADTDGDGEVSLSEFVSSEAAQKMSSLPRPVAPVRRPIQPQQSAQQPVRQQPTSPGIAAPQMGWQQPLPQQQPMQQQPVMPQQPTMNIQPTIRSGIHCRGCGIGLDPNWRFCPVCGNMNMSAHR